MKDMIEECLDLLLSMTKEEADFIEAIISWDNERRAAFKLAKNLIDQQLVDSRN
jgi:hypothetical protein